MTPKVSKRTAIQDAIDKPRRVQFTAGTKRERRAARARRHEGRPPR